MNLAVVDRLSGYRGAVQVGLITPLDSEAKLIKAFGSEADILHLELEDGVPAASKDGARALLIETLRKNPSTDKLTMVRVNPVGTPYLADDIEAVADSRPTAVLLAKCQGPEDIRHVDLLLQQAEDRRGIPPGTILIASMIERIRALQQIDQLATASPRMFALYIGPTDLATEVGYRRSYEGIEPETYWVKSRVIVAAHAAGLLAFDSSCAKFRDLDLTYTQAAWAARIGFDCKFSLSPRQLAVVRKAFAPTEEEVGWAQAVIAGRDAAQQQGVAVWEHDGMFLDEAMIARADAILRARETKAR